MAYSLYQMGFLSEFRDLKLHEKGDALAGIFGSLAFVVAMIALVLQSKELRLSRREAAKTAEALSVQTSLLLKAEVDAELEVRLKELQEYLAQVLEKMREITWSFNPRADSRFAPGLKPLQSKIGKVPCSSLPFNTYIKEVNQILGNLAVELTIFSREGEIIDPPVRDLQLTGSLLICSLIENRAVDASGAFRRQLVLSNLSALRYQLTEIIDGSWWGE